jgi:signal transduction histidine kinase
MNVRSVRVRTTIAASAVVGFALIVAAFALVVFLSRALTANVRDAAEGRASEVAASLQEGIEPGLDLGDPEDQFVQVLDTSGAVVASSLNMAGEPAVAAIAPGDEASIDGVLVPDEGFLVVAIAWRSPADGGTVLVGRTLDDVREARTAAVPLLGVGVPVLTLVVGLVTWWLTGRALRPVESIRAEVESISAGRLDRRVPEPDSRDEIARLATTMNRMLARLEASQSRQRRFVADAAHELRSPVAAIREQSEVAIAHPESSSLEELAQVVHRENLRVEGLVDDLLLLARLDESTRLVAEQVDLDDLVLAEAARLRASTSLTITTNDIGAARVSGDPGGLERVVRNLSENAARHAETVVSLSLRASNGSAIIGVDDDGPGIDPPDRERVFDRFVRLDDARARDEGGTGLGLAIVRAVVLAHRGDVRIGDSPLGGARVEVRLPLVHP